MLAIAQEPNHCEMCCRVDVSERFPLSELARVHELGEAGKFRGKVILTPDA